MSKGCSGSVSDSPNDIVNVVPVDTLKALSGKAHGDDVRIDI